MKKLLILLLATVFMSHLTLGQSFNAVSYPHGNMPSGFSDGPAMGAYNNWKNNYVEYCASNGDHRVRFDNPSQSVSEGIAYGMLLAAYANDKEIFDGLLRYYNRFKNADGVMDWKTAGCSGVLGTGGAADAEFDYAIALIVAHKRWGSDGALNYDGYARDMIAIIKGKEISSSLVPRPGPHWGGDDITNPSYYTPAYFRVFGEYTGDVAYWNSVSNKCYQILAAVKSTLNASYGLVPDWCTSSGGFSAKAAEIGYFQSGTKYHYDAARTPWRITTDYLWFGISEAGDYANQCFQFADARGGCQNIVDGYSMDGSSYGSSNSSTFSGAFAVSYMYAPAGQAGLNGAYNYFVNKVPNGYFNTTLHALYMFTLTGNFWNPLTFGGGGGNCDAVTIPGQVEAEGYCAMSGIQKEDCAEGGQNIGYVDDEDWMSYKITVANAGTYQVSYRVASLNGGNELQLDTDKGNVVLGTMAIPATGGWQNWQTVSHNVNLPAGTYEIGIKANIGGFNLNWFEFSNGTQNVPVTGISVAPATASVQVNATTALSAAVLPSNASDKSVTWSSSNTSIATVSGSGVVTGVAAGQVVITATSSNPSISAQATITVTTGGGGGGCNGAVAVTLPFEYTGVPEQCFEVSEDINFINSWGAAEVTVNGVDITNTWVNNLPAKQNGKYYISFRGDESWAQLEITKAGSARFQTAGLTTQEQVLAIYPNPLTSGNLTIQTPENMLGAQLSVLDISGKEVFTQQIVAEKTTLSKANFTYAGIYFVEVQGRQGKETIKLMVK